MIALDYSAEEIETILPALTPAERAEFDALLAASAQTFDGEDDPDIWARRFFPQTFTRPFTGYQREFWEWGFAVEDQIEQRPRVECEPRGVGKSTSAETLVVRWLARKRMRYVLYVSATDDQAAKHLKSIKRKMESTELLGVYPHLAPRIEKYRNALSNWSGERLVTADGRVVECLSLLGNARGFKTDVDARIDAMILDDIDSSKDSPHMVSKKLGILRDEILPAGNDRTVVLFAQNLIHRNSICAQVLDHRADILSRRHFSGPFPLMKWYDAEKVVMGDGSREWKITAGEAYDPAIDIAYCESLLNQFGKDTFDRECQQDVSKVEEDKDFREWDEAYHVITQSEMVREFEKYRVTLKDEGGFFIPQRWNVGMGFDWGTTRAHPSAVAFVTRPDQTTPYDDAHFVIGEVVLPHFPFDPHLTAELVSPGRVASAVKHFFADYRINDSQITDAMMSHEASAARNTLLEDLPEELQLFFDKWKAARGSGVPQIQNLLEIDYSKPHPFRFYPTGHERAGERLQGRPRIFFVVADGQGELYCDGDGKLRVTGAKDGQGMARARFELPLYSHRNGGQQKIDDDFVDGLRGLMATFGVDAAPMTKQEKRIAKLPDELKPHEVIAKLGTPGFTELYSAQQHALHQIKRDEEKEAEAQIKKMGRFMPRPVSHRRYKGGR